MSKRPNQNYRYSVCFKQKVVEEVKAGLSITEIMRRYGIGGATTVKRWVQRYGDPSMLNEVIYVKMRKETDQIKVLEQENRRLKIALADKTLAYDALETLLEVAGIDQSALKKNTGLPRSGGVTRKGGTA
ncbi:MAG: helix-turn-helix domain-containing protein [Tannerella sp.]|jgi:transposase-like protein|nr:helix-turn-helix domain-containing protein [Tannerella sp.]